MAVKLNQHDLEFILKQVKISEAHANGTPLTEIRIDTDGSVTGKAGAPITDRQWYLDNPDSALPHAIPDPKTPFGLRTVDGSYNNLVEGREMWGAADQVMPRLLDPTFVNDADGDSMVFGPGMATTNTDYHVVGNPSAPTVNGGHTGNVADADPRIISNLISDMSVNNPAAIAAWLSNPLSQEVWREEHGDDAVLLMPGEPMVDNGVYLTDADLGVIHNIAPDEGVSASFNAWTTFFGQFFDHGLDLISKGNNGTVYIPLQPDDPLYVPGSHTNFMVVTRATPVTGAGADGQMGTDDDTRDHINTTTPFVDQNQTYTSHASHQVFLREYQRDADGDVVSSGKLLGGRTNVNGDYYADGMVSTGGLATWAVVKAQAVEMLGLKLSDAHVHEVPLLATDEYGMYLRGPNGYAQVAVMVSHAGDDPVLIHVEGKAGGLDLLNITEADLPAGHGLTGITDIAPLGTRHAFLDDIAHAAGQFDSRGTPLAADSESDLGNAPEALVPVPNGGFDADSLDGGPAHINVNATLGNWTENDPTGWSIAGGGGGGMIRPTVQTIASNGGGNAVFLRGGATLEGDTGVTLEAGRSYGIAFDLGDRLDRDFAGGVARLVTEDGVVLKTAELTPPTANGTWKTVLMSTGIVTEEVDGQTLRIEITHSGANSGQQVLIDNIRPVPIATYDNELLDRHFITGDGRGNENMGLTAVHHVFHSEHNRQVELNKLTILQTGDLDFINDWLTGADITNPAAIPSDIAGLKAFAAGLQWDGERLFQTARFATEMQYQHLVFEEFGRKIQPAIDPFVFNSVTDIDPAIFSEFANVVYRFGHSMLTDDFARIGPDGVRLDPEEFGLIDAFLNPVGFNNDGTMTHDEATGAIVRGMTTTHGNEIDEFVVSALRSNLLGLPLDLAAINIARGRDTGMPTLQEAREQLYASTGSSFLKPYDNWVEFAAGLKNTPSVINFIAAYGNHDALTAKVADPAAPGGEREMTVAEKRAVAMELVMGFDAEGNQSAIGDRLAFLRGEGEYADDKGGLDHVDLWIGGLAEKILLFGGMLGSTFNAIFELQMENLQDADRFYYLTRTQGLHFLDELEANAFSKLIMANTDLVSDPGADGIRGTDDDLVTRHIGVDSFGQYDYILEAIKANQTGEDPLGDNPIMEALGISKVERDMTPGFDAHYDTYLRFTGGEHVVLGGTAGNDVLIGDLGDDGIWGDGGDDYIEGGQGVDLILGGAGNDIILDQGDTGDFIKGEAGDDVIANSNGLDILMGGDGKDVIFVGVDDTEVFGGEGDDFILGGDGLDFLMGNEGDDWIEGGPGFDTTAGDNSELFFNSTIIGHDVMFSGSEEHDFDAESGDDIMVQGESVIRNEGMFGFDWATFQGNQLDAYADMRIRIFTTEEEDILRNRFDKTEALSGWENDDTLIGDDRIAAELAGDDDAEGDGPANNTTQESVFFNDELTQAGVDRIEGLRELLGSVIPDVALEGLTPEQLEGLVAFNGGNILLGGGGSDTLQGNGGDDFLDGDHWLRVRISIKDPADGNVEMGTVDSLKHTFTQAEVEAWAARPGVSQDVLDWAGKSVFELLVDRTISASHLHIVREIVDAGAESGTDTSVFSGLRTDYLITRIGDEGEKRLKVVDTRGIDSSAAGDTVANVEFLRFGDGTVVSVTDILAQPFDLLTIVANAATGTLTAVPQPSTNVPLTYQWEVLRDDGTWSPIAGATSASFLPPEALRGLELRPVASYPGGSVTATSAAIVGLGLDGAGAAVDDDVEGSALQNVIVGLDGDDRLAGGEGNDAMDGGLGDDRVDGGLGDDVLRGGAGNDRIDGRAGFETIHGGDGDDVITGGHDDDVIDGGEGSDTANYEGPLSAMTFVRNEDGSITVSDSLGVEGDGVDTLTNVEFAQVGDELVALTGDNTGPTGDLAFSGQPTEGVALTVSRGTLTDAQGVATPLLFQWQFEEPAGTWTDIQDATGASFTPTQAEVGQALRVVATYTDAFGMVEVATSQATPLVGDQIDGTNGPETLTGTAAADLISGNGGPDSLDGEAGNDQLFGGAGGDQLTGGEGNDLLDGGANNDRLTGGEGNDLLDGGDGNDIAYFAGPVANYSIEIFGSDIVVTDNVGTDGVDTLRNVERLSFDGLVRTVVQGTAGDDEVLPADGNQIIMGLDGNDALSGGLGADVLLGGAGNDTIVWNSNAGDDDPSTPNPTDGHDLIDGGDGTDTFELNGRNAGAGSTETFSIYDRATAESVPGLQGVTFAAGTEIVITRGAVVIAELDNIEEIIVNAAELPAPPSGVAGGDEIRVIGDFSQTSLALNTIRIEGSGGDDTVDISALTSAHRIVFRSNGGNDTIVGTLRPQDVVTLPEGVAAEECTLETKGGITTLSAGGYSVAFVSDGMPEFQTFDGHVVELTANNEDDSDEDDDSDDDIDDTDSDDDDTADGPSVGGPGPDVLPGTPEDDVLLGLGGDDVLMGGNGADVLKGGDGDDYMDGGAGRDVMSGGRGDDDMAGGGGADMVYGDEGHDRIRAGGGDDLVKAGLGNDTVFGEAGDDTIVAEEGDGNDTYYGDEMDGGSGNDTLDMSAITANITADLGTGFQGRGTVSSHQTGNDTIWGIENIVTGSGEDQITASDAVNVMDGGGGNDVFRFLSAADANGDTIMGFQPGDKIDLSGIDANACVTGNQAFTIVSEALSGDRGELLVRHEERDGQDWTVIEGNTTGGAEADFKVSIKGSHDLTNGFDL